MTQGDTNYNPPLNVDQEVDLLEYLNAILRLKYRILLLGISVAAIVFGLSRLSEDMYRSTVVVAVNISNGFGGTKPGQYRGSDVVGLLEYSFMLDEPADNEQDRLLARLSSTGFIELFIEENDLLPYIYRDQWNAAEGKWIGDFQPSMLNASQIFRESMLHAEVDMLSGLLPISITTNSPMLSADLANKFYDRFNRYTANLRLAELKRRSDLLNTRLDSTSNVEMQRSIFRMLETQLAEEIMINAQKDYPLELIQSAQPPLSKSSPRRKLWTILAFVLTVVLSIAAAIGFIILRKLRSALSEYDYKETTNAKKVGADAKSPSETEITSNETEVVEKGGSKTDSPEQSKPANGLDELSEWLD